MLGAGVDVIEGEWRTDLDRHPLICYANSHQNLIILPHLGGVTYESQCMAFTRTAKKLAHYLQSLNDPETTKALSDINLLPWSTGS